MDRFPIPQAEMAMLADRKRKAPDPPAAPSAEAGGATDADLFPEAKKPWAVVKPKGLFVLPNGIGGTTSKNVYEACTVPDFPWKKRFAYGQNKNWWHIGPFVGEGGQREFEAKYPAVHAMAHEAVRQMTAYMDVKEPGGSFTNFVPEAINVHKHAPGWGLGAHYDDTRDIGEGKVLMVSISDPAEDALPRTFQFTDPIKGRKYPVQTANRQVILFKDECYDGWRHESVRNKKQTSTCLSFTIRLKSIDGYFNAADTPKYPKGPTSAARWAAKRVREKLIA